MAGRGITESGGLAFDGVVQCQSCAKMPARPGRVPSAVAAVHARSQIIRTRGLAGHLHLHSPVLPNHRSPGHPLPSTCTVAPHIHGPPYSPPDSDSACLPSRVAGVHHSRQHFLLPVSSSTTPPMPACISGSCATSGECMPLPRGLLQQSSPWLSPSRHPCSVVAHSVTQFTLPPTLVG